MTPTHLTDLIIQRMEAKSVYEYKALQKMIDGCVLMDDAERIKIYTHFLKSN